MNDYENIEKKVKEFVRAEYDMAVKFWKTAEDVLKCRAIAYGAIQFCINNLFPYYNDDLGKWWDKYWEKFNKLALDKQK